MRNLLINMMVWLICIAGIFMSSFLFLSHQWEPCFEDDYHVMHVLGYTGVLMPLFAALLSLLFRKQVKYKIPLWVIAVVLLLCVPVFFLGETLQVQRDAREAKENFYRENKH